MKYLFFLFFVVFCNIKGVAQVIINPTFERTDTPSFRVEKVEITPDTTFVYCSYYAVAGSWANISQGTHLFIRNTVKNLPLLKCVGLPITPQKKTFVYDEKSDILLCFPAIPLNSTFDLVEDAEGTAFNIYGINIVNQYNTSYQELDVSRFANMASFYDSAGDTVKALQYKMQEIDAVKFVYGTKSEPLIVTLFNASVMCDKYGYYEQAIDIARQVGVIHAELWVTSDRNYALYLRTLGNYYSHARKTEIAIQKYSESINLLESIPAIDNEYALALDFAANDYYEIDDSVNALLCQKKCIAARRQIGDPDGYINELYSTLLSGHYNAIRQRIQIVEDELENLPDFVNATSKSVAIILKQLALCYWMIDDNSGAIRCCDKALVIYNINSDTNSEEFADLLSVKCKYQSHSGFSKEAVVTGERAKQLFDSLYVKSIKYAELLSDLAWAYGADYNFEKSISLQTISTEIYEEAKDWLSLAEAYNKVSDYYQRAEKLEDAELYVKKAIAVLNNHNDVNLIIREDAERLGDNSIVTPFAISKIKQRLDYDKINFLQTLAGIFQKEGKITDAINTGKETLILTKNMRDNHAYALHLMIMAQYYLLDKQYINAKDCVEQTFQLDEPPYNIANNKIMLSHICFEMGDTIEALRYAKESASYFKAKGDVENLITTEYVLALFYWKSHEYTKAEQHLSETLDLLRDNISKEFTRMTSEQKQRIWGIYEKYFLLYRHIIEKSRDDGLLQSRLFNYVLFSKSLLLDTGIQSDANRLMITWKDIQRQLSDDDLAIEFISTIGVEGDFNTYHALVIDKNNPTPRMITLYSERELEEIKKTTTRNISDIVGELIWKPILVQYSNAKNIYFSPDGILHILPIEYYNVNSTINMLEQYNMYRLSSTKELISKHCQKQFSSAVLYGGLDYNQLKETTAGTGTKELPSVWRGIANRGGFDPLFNTLVETQEIKDLLDSKNIVTTLYSGEKGTEESFRNLSNQKNNIIHLATHGMYVNPDGVDTKKTEDNFAFLETLANTNDPVKEDAILTHSFLVMAGGNRLVTRDYVSDSNDDGILTSQEISQLDLRGLDLVVLSACESALGDIDNGGVYGLQRGFKKAGANTILMSLDKVDDEATKIIMVEFYKNLMAGKSKQRSLKDAQHYLRQVEKGKYDAPKYWASFILLDALN